MEKPSSKVIEITVISAEGLLVNKKQPAKKNVSVTVKSDPFTSISTDQGIWLTDIDGGHQPENYLSFLSYRLGDDNGEKNGIVNMSSRVIKGSTRDRGCSASCTRQWMEVPAVDKKVSGGVVTVIQVPYRY